MATVGFPSGMARTAISGASRHQPASATLLEADPQEQQQMRAVLELFLRKGNRSKISTPIMLHKNLREYLQFATLSNEGVTVYDVSMQTADAVTICFRLPNGAAYSQEFSCDDITDLKRLD